MGWWSLWGRVIVFVVMCVERIIASVIQVRGHASSSIPHPHIHASHHHFPFPHPVLRLPLHPLHRLHRPSLTIPIHAPSQFHVPVSPVPHLVGVCINGHPCRRNPVTTVDVSPSGLPEEGTLLPCLMGPDQSGRVAYIPLEPSRFPALPEWEEVRPRPVSTMRGRGPRRDVLHELPGIGCRSACPEHTDASAHRYVPRWKGPAGPSAGGSDALGGSCYALFTGVPSATRLQRGSAADGAVYRRSWDLGWKGAMLCCSAPRALTGCLSGSRLDHARVPPPPAPGPRASRP